MSNTDVLKQKIIHLVMGMDNEQALEVLHDVMLKFGNPSSMVEDELTDEEWSEIENDLNKIEQEQSDPQKEVVAHLKQWKNGK